MCNSQRSTTKHYFLYIWVCFASLRYMWHSHKIILSQNTCDILIFGQLHFSLWKLICQRSQKWDLTTSSDTTQRAESNDAISAIWLSFGQLHFSYENQSAKILKMRYNSIFRCSAMCWLYWCCWCDQIILWTIVFPISHFTLPSTDQEIHNQPTFICCVLCFSWGVIEHRAQNVLFLNQKNHL